MTVSYYMNDTIQPIINTKAPLIAAIYARVSTGKQEHEETIESQIDELKKRIEADKNTLPLENIFVDDGWTGKLLQRPALDKMRDAGTSGRFQILYVYDRGRLSRVFTYQEIVLEELRDRDIVFVSLHDINALTPEERVLQSMQGVFHEYERVKIAERMRRGKLYKARNGVIISGNALYGYSYIKKTDTVPARWVVNEEEARIVRMIWHWVGIEGESLRGVIKRLYDLGIKPRKVKHDYWTKGPIIRLLQTDTYVTGKAYYNKWEAVVAKHPLKHDKYKKVKRTSRRLRPQTEWIAYNVPVLIPEYWLFEKVQKVFELNKKFANRKSKGKYLATGRIYCQCGSRMVGDGSNKYGHFYYRCTSHIHHYPLESPCRARGINAKVFDTVLWRELEKQVNDSVHMRQYVVEWLEVQKRNNVNLDEITRLQGLLAGVQEEESRYTKAYGAGSLDLQQFNSVIQEVCMRKISFQEQLEKLTKVKVEKPADIDVDELIAEAKLMVEGLDWDNKIATIRDIIDRIVITEQTGVEVFVQLPMPQTQKLEYEFENRYEWFPGDLILQMVEIALFV